MNMNLVSNGNSPRRRVEHKFFGKIIRASVVTNYDFLCI